MSFERRRFLKSATQAAVSTGMVLGFGRIAMGQKKGKGLEQLIGPPLPIKAQQDALYYFTEATFRPYLNDIFQAPDDWNRMVALKLISVNGFQPRADAMVATAHAQETKSFALMFKSSKPLAPLSSIHQMHHPALGKFGLFLTPREGDGEFYYEAVFNRL